MDAIDYDILALLVQNGRMPLKQLAQEVCLSSPAAAARVARLEKEGVITGYHASVDLQKLDYPVKAFINLRVRPDQKPEFYPFIEACPNVLECCCVTGHYSMLIKVAFPSTQELDAFIGILQRFGDTETQIVFSTAVEPRELAKPAHELSN
ncbi:Lrp/AsnC family transcriptional regulator [Gehongia tenuis]|uniref:Lrp/AsnC family transcriptional regulator n=1 Tax=Gehongia tenuis TaxID=2763655 RepID=A0A926D7T4_9FIRM|nr:Lrp/AsnC family transcriptional regulator [Gehongia tenuis]MBC8531960.1 Lrp/AsnC family transcriptional regulator [Gehongia tenuis]